MRSVREAVEEADKVKVTRSRAVVVNTEDLARQGAGAVFGSIVRRTSGVEIGVFGPVAALDAAYRRLEVAVENFTGYAPGPSKKIVDEVAAPTSATSARGQTKGRAKPEPQPAQEEEEELLNAYALMMDICEYEMGKRSEPLLSRYEAFPEPNTVEFERFCKDFSRADALHTWEAYSALLDKQLNGEDVA